ncbi:hypothetical protein VitviT2T_030243 [Vitis vinifera]|uniref:Uncharacterized protein n=1 Tax=Vitis vinifera TaxID=29760 RepID=A0ABY9E0K0_VITVI|nr:hypothetical protein VitviT2T_030243 [Vitis vinifera]
MERSTKKRMRQMVRIVEEAVAHVPLVTSSTQGPSTISTVPTLSSGDIPYFMKGHEVPSFDIDLQVGGIPDVVTADVNEVQAKEEAEEEDEKRKSIKKLATEDHVTTLDGVTNRVMVEF